MLNADVLSIVFGFMLEMPPAPVNPPPLTVDWNTMLSSAVQLKHRGTHRLACGCAHCVDEWSGEGTLDPNSVPEDVHPLRIESVGRYAIQVSWSDGHESGIYPFVRLRELADAAS